VRRIVETPGLAAQMGQAGRLRAVREFSPERHAEDVLRVYESAVAGARSGAAGAAPAA
jgi:glycosyltransferase involved in cell wall biosynthesis